MTISQSPDSDIYINEKKRSLEREREREIFLDRITYSDIVEYRNTTESWEAGFLRRKSLNSRMKKSVKRKKVLYYHI